MKGTVKACEACREILKDAGYTVEEVRSRDTLDACEICGLRTGVKFCTIKKGEKGQSTTT